MIDIKARIDTIDGLLKENTARSLTYAALECRLTIEHICYERLQIAHDYISHADLRAWQPSQVIKQVEREANEYATAPFRIAIATQPIQKGKEPKSQEDFEAFEYVDIGMQAAIKIRQLTSLWNALSNVALHAALPVSKDGAVSFYGDEDVIRSKVEETLRELVGLSKGNMISSGIGEEVSFTCAGCHKLIKKKRNLLHDKQVVSCIMPECAESYLVHIGANEVEFTRRGHVTTCEHCKVQTYISARLVEKLRVGESLEMKCDACNTPFQISTTLVAVWTR